MDKLEFTAWFGVNLTFCSRGLVFLIGGGPLRVINNCNINKSDDNNNLNNLPFTPAIVLFF